MSLDFAQVANGKPKAKKEKAIYLTKPLGGVPSIELLQKELEQYKPKLAELEKQAKELKVKDQETFQISVDGAATAKGIIKTLDSRKADHTGPYREYINKFNNAIKFFTEAFKRIAGEYSQKGGDYQYQLELAEKRQQKAIDAANIKLQEDLNKQAEKDGIAAPIVTPIKAPKVETVIHTAGGHSQHLRKPWVGEVVNPEKVERQYCEPSQRLINNAVKMGVREMEGVRIYQKVTAVHR